MKNDYWTNVKKRLFSLAKIAITMAAPVVVEAAVDWSYEKAFVAVNEKLHVMYFKTIRNALITLGLNICGFVFLLFNPLYCKIISGAFFLSAIVFTIVRCVLFVRDYGRITFDVCKSVLVEKSMHKGIKEYVYTSYPVIASLYAGLDFAAKYVPALTKVPQLEKIVDRFILEFKNRIILYTAILSVYTVLVYWVAKPLLMLQLAYFI